MPYHHVTNGYYHGWHPFIISGMDLIWLIFLFAVAYLVYTRIKGVMIIEPNKIATKNADDILAERYAKGELTREQFIQMKEDLKKEKINER